MPSRQNLAGSRPEIEDSGFFDACRSQKSHRLGRFLEAGGARSPEFGLRLTKNPHAGEHAGL